LSESPLPERRPRSKREQIHELILRGYSTKSIAVEVHTTPANVWKEKSILKAKGILGAQQPRGPPSVSSSPPSAGQNDIQRESLQNKNNERFNTRSTAATPDFKALYRLFREGKRPIYIILNSEFPPKIVEKEYDRFLKLRKLDRGPIHILLDILPHSPDGISTFSILEKYGYLGFSEIARLVRRKADELSTEDFKGGFDWKTIECTNCSRKHVNVYADPNGRIGMNDSKFVKIDGCHLCLGRA
jgi:hypothetical protein